MPVLLRNSAITQENHKAAAFILLYFWHHHCRHSTLNVNEGLSPNRAEIRRSTWGVQAQEWKSSLVLSFVVLVMVEKKVNNEPPVLL